MTIERTYRGYYITGIKEDELVILAPYGKYAPGVYTSLEEAKKAVDEDIEEAEPKTSTKARRVDIWMQVIKPDGSRLTPVIRNTVKGRSDYANRMYLKYGDGMFVEEYHFDENCNIVIDCTWGA